MMSNTNVSPITYDLTYLIDDALTFMIVSWFLCVLPHPEQGCGFFVSLCGYGLRRRELSDLCATHSAGRHEL